MDMAILARRCQRLFCGVARDFAELCTMGARPRKIVSGQFSAAFRIRRALRSILGMTGPQAALLHEERDNEAPVRHFGNPTPFSEGSFG